MLLDYNDFKSDSNNWEFLRTFLLEMWNERAMEMYNSKVDDLSMSCKFVSLFCFKLFGGTLQGNYNHSYLVIEGKIFDPTYPSSMFDTFKVQKVDPYEIDNNTYFNDDYQESIYSCEPRVDIWINLFMNKYKQKEL